MSKLTLKQKVKNALGKEQSDACRFYLRALRSLDKADTDEKVKKVVDRLLTDEYFYSANLYCALIDLLY